MNNNQPVKIQPVKFYSNAARLSAFHSFRGDYKPLIMQKLKYALLGVFRLEFSRGKKETLELLIRGRERERERKVEKREDGIHVMPVKYSTDLENLCSTNHHRRVFACTRLKNRSEYRLVTKN